MTVVLTKSMRLLDKSRPTKNEWKKKISFGNDIFGIGYISDIIVCVSREASRLLGIKRCSKLFVIFFKLKNKTKWKFPPCPCAKLSATKMYDKIPMVSIYSSIAVYNISVLAWTGGEIQVLHGKPYGGSEKGSLLTKSTVRVHVAKDLRRRKGPSLWNTILYSCALRSHDLTAAIISVLENKSSPNDARRRLLEQKSIKAHTEPSWNDRGT